MERLLARQTRRNEGKRGVSCSRSRVFAKLSRSVVTPILLVLCLALSALGQDVVTPKETRLLLARALNEGAYEEAIPLLMQLIGWFKDSKKRSLIKDLEIYQFQIGLCYYLTGQFDQSEKAFTGYLKKYRKSARAPEAAVYLADGYRFREDFKSSLKRYKDALSKHAYDDDWRADIHSSMARCHLADGQWPEALPYLEKVYREAPDERRANWAATLLCVGYLKEMRLEDVYRLVPYLMDDDSVAARSIVFNVTALEAGDELFADERYREALWLYRLIHPVDRIRKKSERYIRDLKEDVKSLRESEGQYRELLRAQERLAEAEAESTNLDQVEDYALPLTMRIARSYLETRRYREARALFLVLASELDVEEAGEPLYLAFMCSLQLQPWARAYESGLQYIEDYPQGEYFDTVSLTVGQMYATEKEWPQVIDVLTAALETKPNHESVAECMFLIGYACFMEERLPEAITWLEKLNTAYPEHDRVDESTYWLGMSYLFNRNYAQALAEFETCVRNFPKSIYAEDAAFRRATCEYGLSRFQEARTQLLEFNDRYPESSLGGESHMMLADIAGNSGESEEAVREYLLALEGELNIELYNYCTFRCTEMLTDMERFDDVVEVLRGYVERDKEGSNMPLAMHYTSKALWEQGDQHGAMRYLLACVKEHGGDPMALGIDMLLEEWVSRSRKLAPVVVVEAWKAFHTMLQEAKRENDTTLWLRLARIFLSRPNISEKAADLIMASILDSAVLPDASPSVLEFVLDEAQKRNKPELARLAADLIVEKFPETDYIIGARMFLAKRAMDEDDFFVAEEHLNIIRETFASSPEAGRALLLLGRLYIKRRQYARADGCFKSVLGVREWRGPLWPEALYGRGECASSERRYDKAAAYFERIYVLYGNYPSWVAKSYLRRAECLVRIREDGKAREVLSEMVGREDLADAPEMAEAKTMLAKFTKAEQ